ncbi:5-formyltetrahydrofolate cyclo-ligase [Listeria sp. PSOL-1]|uniref:5-formyltetrahydrofolate cyclo-ligase n=1 Tax=Listeria sp. PSOL-1 TaxID=1844999 RepID=UPI0013D64F64|nr:5-formyltetrahydrofolate cyclo-ligase [Listeria sp. PSOL-1]
MNKKEIRQQILKTLSEMPKETHLERSKELAEMLFQTNEWNRAQIIGVTLSRFPEVETSFIIKEADRTGKKIAIPKTYGKEHTMDFHLYEVNDKLMKTKLGLKEPLDDAPFIAKERISLLIVPGVAYQKAGYRIGFGGGFYDRYLANFVGDTVSLLFQEQQNEEFTAQMHDQPVQKLLIY